ncbi:MAG: chemotaxis protein CheD [Pseudomonadota bacterium]
MERSEKIHVQIGQVKTGREGQSLNAILGSCVGIGFLHRDRRIFGLAHCLLAQSGTRAPSKSDLGGRHVDQAIRSLEALMKISDEERRRVRVFLCGGANMSLPPDTDPKRLVGTTNAEFARKAIREAGFRLSHHDLGGMLGRQVTIDCTSGEYAITEIPRLGM